MRLRAPPGRPVSERVGLLRLGERAGTLSRHFADVDTFAPTVEVPRAAAYAVVGVERGEEFCGVRPGEAAPVIAERAPHVGWCWEGNHHTWLGVASAAARVAPVLAGAAAPM